MPEKMWSGEPFWGLGYEWDPDWVLTDRQRELRDLLIELCEKEMRANAKRSDDNLLYPRRNLELLGEHGFLALTVPEEYGGLGENHVAFAMTCETIARYGCASTAMCYVMHMGAVNTIMLRPTDELIEKYIRPLNSGKIGTLSYSDPETGSHFWYPISSGRRALQRRLQGQQEGVVDDLRRLRRLLRRADHQPRLHGLRRPVGVRDRRRGRQVAALVLGRAGPARQPVGPDPGRGRLDPRRPDRRTRGRRRRLQRRGRRPVVPDRLLLGVERHRARRDRHRQAPHDAQAPRRRRPARGRLPDDPGLRRRGRDGHQRLPRLFVFSVAQAMDEATDHNTRRMAPGEFARANFLHWAWQIKFEAAKNTAHVVDKMLHACGGSGYKRDMELERYLRDAKAGWVMGPTNEVLRQFVGKAVLLGFDASTTGTRPTTAARSRTSSRSSTPTASASSPRSCWPRSRRPRHRQG